ncbi:MAG: hypothetical protein JWM34_2314 [Ilumatobacteraceae bacterium]|nr:hypothetical protein [Ilumatobacteraceae bacterium]
MDAEYRKPIEALDDAAGEGPAQRPVGRDVVRALLLWIPGGVIFFRSAFESGFDKIMGNSGDARLQVYGHEHWLQVLRGQVSWTSPQFFFPTKGVLGYSDTFILNEVFFMPLRAFGMDEFLAFQWTLVLMSIVGFVGMALFLRRTFRLTISVCAALATIFVFANNMAVKSGHLQLYSLYWLPVLMLLVRAALRSPDRWRAALWGAGAGGFLGLLFFSTYYIAWFAVFSTCVFAATMVLIRLATRRGRSVWVFTRRHVLTAAAFAIAFALAMIPFVITYLPVLRSSGGRTYDDAMLFAARPKDMLNLSGTNYVWGSVMRGLLTPARLINSEVALAPTPLLLLAVAAAAVIALWLRRGARSTLLQEACLSCAVTVTALLFLPVRFGWGSLWRLAWTVVPGANAIRAIDRLVLLCGLFAVVAIGIALRLLGDRLRPRPRWVAVGTFVLLALVILEQLNLGETSSIDRSDEIEALTVAPAPPGGCRSFYVYDSVPNSVPGYAANVDAMLISQHFRLPTINGYSGQFPEGFPLLDTNASTYLQSVHAWAAARHLSPTLCSYDRTGHVWAGPGA